MLSTTYILPLGISVIALIAIYCKIEDTINETEYSPLIEKWLPLAMLCSPITITITPKLPITPQLRLNGGKLGRCLYIAHNSTRILCQSSEHVRNRWTKLQWGTSLRPTIYGKSFAG